MAIKRKIIEINEDLCDGCGACIDACAEGALQLVDGKAKLIREIYCDGLGACLGDCPTGALKIIEREAEDFDEAAVEEHLANQDQKDELQKPPSLAHFAGCPGSAMRQFAKSQDDSSPLPAQSVQSQLGHWPVQLKLVPPHAPFLKGADILICADCVPFALPDLHTRYLAGKAVLVGCPKLDDLQYYRDKLKEIFAQANPKSITVLKMEVPCCGGIAYAALEAAEQSAPEVPVDIITIGVQGNIKDQRRQENAENRIGGLL